ncbi:cystatin-B-like [Myotis lucifugus]|nr:cystatin-B-like [Myotis lucifugus]
MAIVIERPGPPSSPTPSASAPRHLSPGLTTEGHALSYNPRSAFAANLTRRPLLCARCSSLLCQLLRARCSAMSLTIKGGLSETRPATAKIQAIADKVKSQLEEKENKKYPIFKATEYKSQVVQGTNYFIKVQVADDDFVHLRVFEGLTQENEALALSNYQTNKTKQDELTSF